MTVRQHALRPEIVFTPAIGSYQTEFTFDSFLSRHLFAGQSIVQSDWDMDGDGLFEKTGSAIAHAFRACGTFPVTLRVRDGLGRERTTTRSVLIEPP